MLTIPYFGTLTGGSPILATALGLVPLAFFGFGVRRELFRADIQKPSLAKTA
ncbi:hypothetical protein [Fodinicola acaciae]|uniref:hypothetical protein n=1 Tax=Fodinicola acaciae TaxID=2681555 RepID=UPI0013D27C31|nr:hypothetical protein [Fodinicola acaciae]